MANADLKRLSNDRLEVQLATYERAHQESPDVPRYLSQLHALQDERVRRLNAQALNDVICGAGGVL